MTATGNGKGEDMNEIPEENCGRCMKGHSSLRIMIRILFFIFLFSCTPRNAHSFYIFHRYSIDSEKEVFKLALEEKRVDELQGIIERLDASTAKALGTFTCIDIDYHPDIFSEYILVGKDASGKKIIDCQFRKNQPFSLEYLTKFPEMKVYSIERFFSREEQQKMETLIPSWKERNKQ